MKSGCSSGPETFAFQNILVARNFFSVRACAGIRKEMGLSEGRRAAVLGKDGRPGMDMEARRVKVASLPARTVSSVEERLMEFKSVLENFFEMPLRGCEKPQFLAYKPGDFHRAHADRADRRGAPDFLSSRLVSTIIFLNAGGRERARCSYRGGELIVDASTDSRAGPRSFSVTGETGLLIAFRSDVIHEVREVSRGERYTIATWFF